jgi:hypothetical protein
MPDLVQCFHLDYCKPENSADFIEPPVNKSCTALHPTDRWLCCLRQQHAGDHEAWGACPSHYIAKWA